PKAPAPAPRERRRLRRKAATRPGGAAPAAAGAASCLGVGGRRPAASRHQRPHASSTRRPPPTRLPIATMISFRQLYFSPNSTPREPPMDTLRQDLRYALRSLRRSPGFAAVAVLTLALGIGANTAIFSVARGLVFEVLPFDDAERLVNIDHEIGRAHV